MKNTLSVKKILVIALAALMSLGALTACGKVATMVQRQNNNSNRGINIHSEF